MKRGIPRKPRVANDSNGRSESVKRSQIIYEQLKKGIITGAIQRGESLTETQLADRFECSQAPVREACIALLYEGFLTTTPYKGFSVSEITLKEIKDLYEMRLLVECAAAEAAAGLNGASAPILEEIESHIRIQQEGPADLWRYLSAEVGFHMAIAKASDNDLLQKFTTLAWGRFQQFYYRTVPLRQGRVELDTVNEHSGILDAIRERNPGKAKNLMHQHVLLGRETALKLYFGF